MYLQLKALKPTNNNYYLVPFLTMPAVKCQLRLTGNDTSDLLYYYSLLYSQYVFIIAVKHAATRVIR